MAAGAGHRIPAGRSGPCRHRTAGQSRALVHGVRPGGRWFDAPDGEGGPEPPAHRVTQAHRRDVLTQAPSFLDALPRHLPHQHPTARGPPDPGRGPARSDGCQRRRGSHQVPAVPDLDIHGRRHRLVPPHAGPRRHRDGTATRARKRGGRPGHRHPAAVRARGLQRAAGGGLRPRPQPLAPGCREGSVAGHVHAPVPGPRRSDAWRPRWIRPTQASCALLQSLGFTLEGRLRQRWVTKGQADDTNFYGCLAQEWPAGQDGAPLSCMNRHDPLHHPSHARRR